MDEDTTNTAITLVRGVENGTDPYVPALLVPLSLHPRRIALKIRHRMQMHDNTKKSNLFNVSPWLWPRGKWDGPRQDFIRVDSVLNHTVETTVENIAAKHRGGALVFLSPEPSALIARLRRFCASR